MLLVAIAALFAASVTPTAYGLQAVVAGSTSQCSSFSTCYEGGVSSTPCTVSSGGCPPCITFGDQGCYVKIEGACPFGVDCASAWDEAAGDALPSSGSSKTSSIGTNSNSDTTNAGKTTPADAEAGAEADAATSAHGDANGGSPKGSLTSTTVDTSLETTSDLNGVAGNSSVPTASSTSGSTGPSAETLNGSGSDMSVVFAIIGAAIGVIAVAVIFLTLVRRSNAAHDEDEDDMANTMRGFSKGPVAQGPQSTTGAAVYSSYNGSQQRPPGMSATNGVEIGLDTSKGVPMNAVSYYNQQPLHNSAAPSPRVAGRAIPSQPVGITPGTGMTRPYGGGQNFGTTSGFGASALASPGVGGSNQVPSTPVQHHPPGGVAPSPHVRKESLSYLRVWLSF
uniref:RxLR effector candidate protein n=1 Tax=Hyaloperonospora arabidopsidis (strain Emoy2) TaxID=559515 RepID=M4BTU8_HYAAE